MSSASSHCSSTEFNDGFHDYEISIASICQTRSFDNRTFEDRIKETTSTTPSVQTPPSLGVGAHVDESDDGFRTPTNMKIPVTTICPPAPIKPKSRKRFFTSLIQDELQEEGDLQLMIEVDVWLDFLEDEDRKRMRIKRARRQEEAGNDDTTWTTTL